ncbi:Terminase-like family protein [compost metagenome]
MTLLEEETRKGNVPAEGPTTPPPCLLEWILETYPSYKAGWVHRLICSELERFSAAVARGESPRLMIFVPPRHGKTFIVSERFPVWHMGQHPDHGVVVSGYNLDLPKRSSKRARGIARDAKVMRHFSGFALDDEKQAVEEWETTAGGFYKAVGVGSALTGSGCHILVIDDPVKDREEADSETIRQKTWEWYTDVAATRLAPGGGIIVIMTRWHESDLAGMLLDAAKKGDEHADKWRVLRFPAIAEEDEYWEERLVRKAGEALHPERWPLHELLKKKALGLRTWLSLYQQRPTAAEGNILKRDMWRFYKVAPDDFDAACQSWDCKFKKGVGDFVSGQVWGRVGGRFYLLHRVRGRYGFGETKRAIKNTRRLYPEVPAILVEDAANGPAIVEELQEDIPGVIAVPPRGGKLARAQACVPYLEAGNVYLPDPDLPGNEWVAEFIEECAAFPQGAYDDDVDSFSQAVTFLARYAPFEPEAVEY